MSKLLSTQTDPWSELTDGGLGNMFPDFERFCLSAIIGEVFKYHDHTQCFCATMNAHCVRACLLRRGRC